MVEGRPSACQPCGALLLGDDPHPERQQVTEVPPCGPWGSTTAASRWSAGPAASPPAAPGRPSGRPGAFGLRVQATAGYLSGRLGLSQRETQEALQTLYHREVGLGSGPALEQAVSTAMTQKEQQRSRIPDFASREEEAEWFDRETRVIVEKSCIPVAAIISAQDLERLNQLEQERAERFKALDESWEAFKGVPTPEIEAEVARAVASARRKRRAQPQGTAKPA
ncbi:MAG: hypothetical protein HY690_15700 [Chloroflexi bacterium]|nr:hypothetical protein [Chloroflexota bacterium]